jgi:hypothetical protein
MSFGTNHNTLETIFLILSLLKKKIGHLFCFHFSAKLATADRRKIFLKSRNLYFEFESVLLVKTQNSSKFLFTALFFYKLTKHKKAYIMTKKLANKNML